MKTSQFERLRLVFALVPRSISLRLRQLTGKTAGELLRLLCELTIGFRKSSIVRSYSQFGEILGKSAQTIARAAKLLLRSGDVVVQDRPGRSYRWSVLLEPSDILEDPARVCVLRSAVDKTRDLAPVAAAEPEPSAEEAAPAAVEEPVEVSLPSEPPASVAQDLSERDVLLKRLTNIGMSRRVAKELLEQNDAAVIVAALERAKGRSDIKNRAAYVLCEVRDGGYDESREMGAGGESKTAVSDAPKVYSSAELTRAEMMAHEAEKAERQQHFEQALQGLQERCSRLSEGLKAELRECCQRHIAQLVPQTSRREMLLESPAYKKLAFKEVMERFFGLIDQGFCQEEALTKLAW